MNDTRGNPMALIRRRVGTWYGEGIVAFPTIATFAYREELTFVTNDVQSFLRYEQRTWKKMEAGEYLPSHWEVGFWRVLPGGEVEVLSAHGGGRVEVLCGILEPTRTGFVVNLRSTLVANDARLNHTARQFSLQDSTLQYTMQMSTNNALEMTSHARATLTRAEAYMDELAGHVAGDLSDGVYTV